MEPATFTWSLLGGALIAFAAAAIAVGVDLQETVKARLGALANISVLTVRQGWLILFVWGVFDTVMYILILNHKEWSEATFGFNLSQNKVGAGLAVGVSVVFIIRSKLGKIGSIELGGEYAYLWSKAYVLKAVSQKRSLARVKTQRQYEAITIDIARFPRFYTDLAKWVLERADAVEDEKPKILEQVRQIRKGAVGDPDQNLGARRAVVGVAIDYFGPADLDAFAKEAGYL